MNQQTRIIKSLTQEEQELLCFFRPVGYHTRLQQYLECPEAFAKETMQGGIALSKTKTFRRCLLSFIRTFQPKVLPANNALWLHLEKSGRFTVRLGKDGEIITGLNEKDSYIFQYLCFLQLRFFWKHLQERCRFPPVTLPVFIKDFPECYEKSEELLELALESASQVILL